MTMRDDTLSLVLGEWRLERVLHDRLTGTGGRFEGTAIVHPADHESGVVNDSDSAIYEERGRIEFGAHQGPSHRTLKFKRLESGAVAVRFADDRPFFELDLRAARCEALHPCGPDDYELSFELKSPDLIIESWAVRGPTKDYEAETVWRRVTATSSHQRT